MFQRTLKGKATPIWQILLAVMLILAVAGCGNDALVNDDTDGGGGGTSDIDPNLRISRFMEGVSDTISQLDAISVQGFVVDSNDVGVNMVQVYYYAVPDNIGYFSKAVDTSRVDGSFATAYLPVDTGDVEIWVQVAGNSTNQTGKQVHVTGSSGGSGGDFPEDYSFRFVVPEGFVLADGENTVDISVVINTGIGEPAMNGTVVKLEAGEKFIDNNGDGYFTENVDEVDFDANGNDIWDKIGSVPSMVTTVDSVATFTYTAGVQSGLVFIRATVGEGSSAIYGELSLSLRPSEEVAYIKMSASSPDMQVKATGGVESTNLIAYCYDRFGNPVQQDIPVEFNIISGPNGGENIEGQGTGPAYALTNVVGFATATMLSGTISGTVAAQAMVGSVLSDVILIDINAGPPHNISVGVDPCNILGCGWINETANVVALVEDVYDNPVMDSTVVYFTTNTIGMVEASSLTGDGIATTIFRSTDECLDGRAWIVGETDGGRVKDSTLLWVTGHPYYVDIYSYPSSLVADGKDYGKVYVEVLDANGNFVLDGNEVEFEFWPEGSIENASTSDGCVASVAITTLTSSVLSKDYSYSIPDNGIGAIGILSATAGAGAGVSSSVNVTILTGFVHSEQSQINVESKVAPESSVPMVIVIKDRAGNPLGGHLLTATASLGTISNDENLSDIDSIYTNEYGEGVGFQYIAPAGLGNAYITVTDNDPVYGGISLTKKIKIDFDE